MQKFSHSVSPIAGTGHSERVDEHAYEYIPVLGLTRVMNPIHQWYNQGPEFHANGFWDEISAISALSAEEKPKELAFA